MEEASLSSWTAVGLSAAVLPGTACRALVGDHDLVIWRGRDRQVRVWENRCPHRGMRLSYGFVRGDRLTCCYHGWTYDGEGACTLIPAHPDLAPPKAIRIGQYARAEHAGIIWAASGSIGMEAPSFPGDWIGCRSIAIDRPREEVDSHFASGRFILSHPDQHGEINRIACASSLNGDGVHRIELHDSHLFEAVLCAGQPVSGTQTMLHVSVRPRGAAGKHGEALRHVSDWLKEVRTLVENRRAGIRTPGVPRARLPHILERDHDPG